MRRCSLVDVLLACLSLVRMLPDAAQDIRALSGMIGAHAAERNTEHQRDVHTSREVLEADARPERLHAFVQDDLNTGSAFISRCFT